jgi:uncharacterized repeat protein (TIGR01451 family)
MPIFCLPKWLRYPRKRHLLALFLISTLLHPTANVQAQTPDLIPDLINAATASYSTADGPVSRVSNQIVIGYSPELIDPSGNLLGCDGQPLASYAGFSMSLYEPDATGLGLGNLVALTPTQGADSIPPNSGNVNPFPLLANAGRYNFLLDSGAGLTSPVNAGLNQTDADAQYILVIRPPADSRFGERRVRIEMLGTVRNPSTNTAILSYRAISLDGQPISVDGSTELTRSVTLRNANIQALTFFEFGVDSTICDSQQIKIVKTADRSAAQPGDVVVYRLNIQNVAQAEIGSVIAVDTLPTGFVLLPESVTGRLEGNSLTVTAQVSNNTVSFSVAEAIAPNQTFDIIYATRLTADALRGSGRNSAIVTGRRTDSGYRIQDGPSTHRVLIDPGILSDCGTLIGRVFEDKNFDGEQQPGEAGIPNAVIFLDDGNRIVTDADGLYSVQKMLPGQRTGTLDLSSLPGYTLAPNLYFNERNSNSRLVNLAPGGLVRMNFGVTPTFEEEM